MISPPFFVVVFLSFFLFFFPFSTSFFLFPSPSLHLPLIGGSLHGRHDFEARQAQSG